MWTLSQEEGAVELESNQKSSLRVLSLSWIFDFVGLFVRVDTDDEHVLIISMITKLLFKVVFKYEKSAVDRSWSLSKYYTHSLREINEILMAILGLVYLIK